LETIAEDIGKMGTYVALLIVHVLLFRYFLQGLSKRGTDLFGGERNEPAKSLFVASLRIWLEYVIVGVAVIVMAVPEGLPLAVMLSLAYSIKKMLEDHNDVKRLASCEIMGGADNICSDKTGTLTLNMMKVTNIWAGKDIIVSQELDQATKKMSRLNWKDLFPNDIHPMHIEHNIACNTASKPGATDKSMSELIERCGTDEKALQAKHLTEHLIRFPFSSKRKRMSTILENIQTKNSYGKRLHIKGASEIVKNCCSHYLDVDGNVKEMTDEMKGNLDNVINNYARQALRTICLAYKDLMPNECGAMHDNPKEEDVKDIEKSGLTLICIFGIMDIVRPEVPGAVKQIQNAGVTVRMVTGDNIVTARAIAVLCNIISPSQIDDEICCMEGPEFYEKMGGLVVRNDKEEVGNYKLFKELMPRMKVMARARPMDKYLMVTGLR
jgi:Ca2+ transporting ATPase